MNCPRCRQPMRPDTSAGAICVAVWTCDTCDTVLPRATPTRQLKLPMDRGRQTRAVRTREEVVERDVDTLARDRGWAVLSTVRHRKGVWCSDCRRWLVPKGGDGCSPGLPDRLIAPPWLPGPLWMGIELKGSHTVVSPEQRVLAAQGRIVVVRSAAELDAYMREAEATARFPPG